MTKSAAGCKELCCSKRLRAGACFLEQPWAKTRHNICKEKTGFRQTEIAMIKFKRAGLACVLLIASSLAQGPTTFHPGFNFFSRQQDVQLGQESAAQVRRQMQIVKDPFLNDYVNRVGRKLANTPEARASGFPFTFEVVADPSINAFALPGGPMFINTRNFLHRAARAGCNFSPTTRIPAIVSVPSKKRRTNCPGETTV